MFTTRKSFLSFYAQAWKKIIFHRVEQRLNLIENVRQIIKSKNQFWSSSNHFRTEANINVENVEFQKWNAGKYMGNTKRIAQPNRNSIKTTRQKKTLADWLTEMKCFHSIEEKKNLSIVSSSNQIVFIDSIQNTHTQNWKKKIQSTTSNHFDGYSAYFVVFNRMVILIFLVWKHVTFTFIHAHKHTQLHGIVFVFLRFDTKQIDWMN